MFSQTSMLQLTWMDPLLNRRLAKFKKDFNKLLYTTKMRCSKSEKGEKHLCGYQKGEVSLRVSQMPTKPSGCITWDKNDLPSVTCAPHYMLGLVGLLRQ